MSRSEKLGVIRSLLQTICKSVQEAESIFASVSLRNDYYLDNYWKWLQDSLHKNKKRERKEVGDKRKLPSS
jgi:hypothetical protein